MHESTEHNEVTSAPFEAEIDAEAILPNPDLLQATSKLAELNTEELLHRVVEAAEHNQAIEKLLELRHEVKDRPEQKASGAAVSQVGDILPAHPAFTPSHAAIDKRRSKISQLMNDRSMYGYAVRYGFVVAVLLIILVVITVIVLTRFTR